MATHLRWSNEIIQICQLKSSAKTDRHFVF